MTSKERLPQKSEIEETEACTRSDRSWQKIPLIHRKYFHSYQKLSFRLKSLIFMFQIKNFNI